MKTTINWARIVSQDRAKAIGIPWSKEDELALKSGISPDDVRAGILTKKEVKKADEKQGVDLERLPKDELIKRAEDLGIILDKDAVVRSDIISEIEKKEESKKDLLKMTRPELSKIAKELKIEFEYIKTTKEDFVKLIEEVRN